MGADLWLRAAVTAGALIAAWVATRIPLPGLLLDPFEGSWMPGAGPAGHLMSVVSLGLNPAISAFLIVEFAALVMPEWRWLRTGGPAARRKLLRATYVLATFIALAQGYGISLWLQTTSMVSTPSYALLVELTLLLAATSLLAFGLAGAVSRYGLGNGFSVLLAGAVLPQLWQQVFAVHTDVQAGLAAPGAGLLAVVLLALVLWATHRLFRSRWSGTVPAPTSGVVPLTLAAGILAFPFSVQGLLGVDLSEYAAWLQSSPWTHHAVTLVLVTALTGAFAALFNRTSKVVELNSRAGGAADSSSTGVRRHVLVGTAWTLVFLWGLYVVPEVAFGLAGVQIVVDVVMVAVFAAVTLDLAAEWRFRRATGAVVSVWPVHQLFAAPVASKVLADGNIPVLARGLRHRALLQFFGPYVPIELMVPRDRATEAEERLRAILGPAVPGPVDSGTDRPSLPERTPGSEGATVF